MSTPIPELLYSLQLQLHQRGASGFRTLQRCCELNDRDGTGIFDFAEVEAILGKVGLFIKRQDLTRLYRHFDKDQNERLYYPDLLNAIKGPLSERRANIINQVFDTLDERGHGAVDVESIIQRFNPAQHPEALSGARKREELVHDFKKVMDGAGATNNHAVTRDEFLKYYHGISASVPGDDNYFVRLMERVWNVKEHVPKSLAAAILGSSASTSATPLLDRLRSMIREKIRQKTSASKKSELENVRLVFRFFDMSGTGNIVYKDFKQSLERFGIVLDSETMQALFDEFDTEKNGTINYLEFATAVYPDDQASPAFHQWQRTQALKASQRLAEEAARPASRREYIDANQILVSSPVPAEPSLPGGKSSGLNGAARSATIRRTLTQKEREDSVLPTLVFVSGGPASGKSTICARMAREFGFVPLSTSALLRDEVSDKSSSVGKEIAALQASRSPIPPRTLVQLLRQAISRHVTKDGSLYFVCDDFPTNMSERKEWDEQSEGKVEVPFVIYLEAPQPVLTARLEVARAQGVSGGGVSDLSADGVRCRFASYVKDTLPVVNSFGAEQRLHAVDAARNPDEVYRDVQQVVAEL